MNTDAKTALPHRGIHLQTSTTILHWKNMDAVFRPVNAHSYETWRSKLPNNLEEESIFN